MFICICVPLENPLSPSVGCIRYCVTLWIIIIL